DETASPSPGNEAAPQPSPLGDGPTAPEVPQVTYESRMSELQQNADQLLSRGDRKVWQSEIANGERTVAKLEAQDKAIRDAAPTGSGGANRRYYAENRAKL
ncbi:hypothetical protein ELD29_28610, partial [Klebsiella pneumoniae]|nr:hypothetical protein [Klebsiella pneumoniae]